MQRSVSDGKGFSTARHTPVFIVSESLIVRSIQFRFLSSDLFCNLLLHLRFELLVLLLQLLALPLDTLRFDEILLQRCIVVLEACYFGL